MVSTQKITPCLWFETNALEAAEFYTSVLPNSSIDEVHRSAADYPGGTAGSVLLVTFTRKRGLGTAARVSLSA